MRNIENIQDADDAPLSFWSGVFSPSHACTFVRTRHVMLGQPVRCPYLTDPFFLWPSRICLYCSQALQASGPSLDHLMRPIGGDILPQKRSQLSSFLHWQNSLHVRQKIELLAAGG